MPFEIDYIQTVTPENAGLFVSRGKGYHPRRTIESYELIVVDAGLLSLQEGDRAFEVGAGEALILDPGVVHFGTAEYPGNLRYYWIHFHYSSIESIRRESVRETHGYIPVPKHARLEAPERLTELFRWFIDEQEAGTLGSQRASLLTMMMLAEVSSGVENRSSSRSQAPMVETAHQIIRTRFADDISTSTVAAEVGCNPDYLGRAYKASHGRTILEAIHHYRTKEAKHLLLDSEQNIDEIAFECGYSSSSYFRRVFRRLVGVAPLQFRKLYSRLHVNTE